MKYYTHKGYRKEKKCSMRKEEISNNTKFKVRNYF